MKKYIIALPFLLQLDVSFAQNTFTNHNDKVSVTSSLDNSLKVSTQLSDKLLGISSNSITIDQTVTKRYVAETNQTLFVSIEDMPVKGTVSMSVNGNRIKEEAFEVRVSDVAAHFTYIPENNNNYNLLAGDIVVIVYLKAN